LGKVRDRIERDDHAVAQWIYRKLVNHDPLSARDPMHATDGAERIRHVEGTQEIEYVTTDKVFHITVEEIDKPKIKAVQPSEW
jgi:hypothetical protein